MLSTNYTGKMDLLVKTKRCYVKTKRCYAFLFICVPICYHTSVDPLPSSPPTLSLEFFCRLHHQWQTWVAVLTGIASRFARYTASEDRCADWHSIAVSKIHRVGRPLCRVLISKGRFIVVNKAKAFLFWATCSLQQGCKSVHDTVEIARSWQWHREL